MLLYPTPPSNATPARRSNSSDSISVAVHESVSGAVWDCLKYIVGWESLVKGDSLVTVCSRTGLDLDAPSDPGGEIRVEAVAPNSSWEQAGLQSGDVIARVNGRPVDAATIEWPAGASSDGVSVTVERGEALIELTVRLEPPK